MLETSALTADAAPFQSIATLAGASYTAASGQWSKQNGKASQECVRGWLDYPVTLVKAGVYQLDLAFTPVASADVSPDYEVVFSADGKTIQRESVTVAANASGHAKILSPWLAAGSHTLRAFIDNSYYYRRVTVDQLEILAARGPDANSNGRPDWVDARLARTNSLEAPSESLTSPVCLEGNARWSELTTVAGAPVQTAPNDRWYANVPLHPSQPTTVNASLENGGLTLTRQVNWLPANLLTCGNLTIRQGDALKLTAFTGTEAVVDESASITVEGQTHTIQAIHPFVHAFTTPGTFLAQVTHTLNGNATTHTVTIKVVAAPAIESPVCVVGYYREVNIPALPNGVTLQFDNRIEIRSTTTYPAGSKLDVLRLSTLEDRSAVYRLGGSTGPIMGILPFRAMRIRESEKTGVMYVKDLGNNTWDLEMPIIVDGRNSSVSLKYEIFLGGVTFDDGSSKKTLTFPTDINQKGDYTLHFTK